MPTPTLFSKAISAAVAACAAALVLAGCTHSGGGAGVTTIPTPTAPGGSGSSTAVIVSVITPLALNLSVTDASSTVAQSLRINSSRQAQSFFDGSSVVALGTPVGETTEDAVPIPIQLKRDGTTITVNARGVYAQHIRRARHATQTLYRTTPLRTTQTSYLYGHVSNNISLAYTITATVITYTDIGTLSVATATLYRAIATLTNASGVATSTLWASVTLDIPGASLIYQAPRPITLNEPGGIAVTKGGRVPLSFVFQVLRQTTDASTIYTHYLMAEHAALALHYQADTLPTVIQGGVPAPLNYLRDNKLLFVNYLIPPGAAVGHAHMNILGAPAFHGVIYNRKPGTLALNVAEAVATLNVKLTNPVNYEANLFGYEMRDWEFIYNPLNNSLDDDACVQTFPNGSTLRQCGGFVVASYSGIIGTVDNKAGTTYFPGAPTPLDHRKDLDLRGGVYGDKAQEFAILFDIDTGRTRTVTATLGPLTFTTTISFGLSVHFGAIGRRMLTYPPNDITLPLVTTGWNIQNASGGSASVLVDLDYWETEDSIPVALVSGTRTVSIGNPSAPGGDYSTPFELVSTVDATSAVTAPYVVPHNESTAAVVTINSTGLYIARQPVTITLYRWSGGQLRPAGTRTFTMASVLYEKPADVLLSEVGGVPVAAGASATLSHKFRMYDNGSGVYSHYLGAEYAALLLRYRWWSAAANATNTAPTAYFGGLEASPAYLGAPPNFAGIYAINPGAAYGHIKVKDSGPAYRTPHLVYNRATSFLTVNFHTKMAEIGALKLAHGSSTEREPAPSFELRNWQMRLTGDNSTFSNSHCRSAGGAGGSGCGGVAVMLPQGEGNLSGVTMANNSNQATVDRTRVASGSINARGGLYGPTAQEAAMVVEQNIGSNIFARIGILGRNTGAQEARYSNAAATLIRLDNVDVLAHAEYAAFTRLGQSVRLGNLTVNAISRIAHYGDRTNPAVVRGYRTQAVYNIAPGEAVGTYSDVAATVSNRIVAPVIALSSFAQTGNNLRVNFADDSAVLNLEVGSAPSGANNTRNLIYKLQNLPIVLDANGNGFSCSGCGEDHRFLLRNHVDVSYDLRHFNSWKDMAVGGGFYGPNGEEIAGAISHQADKWNNMDANGNPQAGAPNSDNQGATRIDIGFVGKLAE